jgi:cell division protein FtsW
MTLVLMLLAAGITVLSSVSGPTLASPQGGEGSLAARQTVMMALGLLLLLAAMNVDYRRYASTRLTVAGLIVTGLLLGVVLFCAPSHGASRWIPLGGFRFQPSELAKLALVVFTAHYLDTKGAELHNFRRGLLPYLLVLGAILGLVVVEPDLGTTFCLAATAGFLLFLAGLQWRYIGAAALVALASFYFFIWNVPYRRLRFLVFMNPNWDPFGAGYNIRQSLIAIGSGGWRGLGYAEGVQKAYFLPEPQNDFVFSVIGEELGLWGTLSVLTLFAVLAWRGIRIALRSDTRFGRYLGLGLIMMLFLQALVNMSVAVSLCPTKGIPLPFISAGGSSLITVLFAMGVMLNISRTGRREPVLAAWAQEEAVVRADERV